MRQFKVTERFTVRSGRAVSSYLNEVDKHHPLSPKEEVELANKIQAGDIQARNKLATSNLRFVLTVAKMYTQDPELYADLVSAGNIGLIEAAEKFDPSRGFKFISFAVWHIRKEMLKHLGDHSRMVRIPQNKVNELRKILDAANRLTMSLGREASIDEVIEQMQKSGDPDLKTLNSNVILDVLSADKKPTSMDAHFDTNSPGDSGTLHDLLPSGDFDPDDFVNLENMRNVISRLVDTLAPLPKDIVLRRHGLGKSTFEETFTSIGHDLGMSGERVRQIYTKALRMMMSRARKSGINRNSVFATI